MDDPPPLDSLPGQRAAVSAPGIRVSRQAEGDAAPSSTADVSCAGGFATRGIVRPLRRGFLDSSASPARGKGKTDLPVVAPAKIQQQAGHRPAVPDAFILPEARQAQQAAAFKAKALEALRPNAAMVESVASQPELLSGFDDPEVMAAVAEVAGNPAAFEKWKGQPKVMEFYRRMAGVVGDRLTALGQS